MNQQAEPLEHATSYEETQSWRTRSQTRTQAPTLPTQTSQGSSTRSIPPSSSAHTSPSHLTTQPARTRQQSRGSSTLTSLPASTTHTRPSTENSARAAARHPVSEKPNGEHSQRSQTPVQGRAPPKLPSLREEHRYCRRCSIIKPPRTHHCRACGMVRLIFFHFMRR
jgi:palmitoyltransferase